MAGWRSPAQPDVRGEMRSRDFFASGFDPALIVGQIAVMQALLYIALGAWLLLLNGLAGRPATAVGLEQMFSAHALRLSHPGGWIALSAFFINSLAGGCFLCVVVERAKKCLDFTVTSHVLHLCACTAYDGFPGTWEWWVITTMNIVVMAMLGEYLCMRREMRDIPLLSFRH
jgi:hypothetical protein